MKSIQLTENQIHNVVKLSKNYVEAILNLFVFVIPDKWENIESFNYWPICSSATGVFILDIIKDIFPNQDFSIGLLWLNKGFSSNHNELDFLEIGIPDNCYSLYVKSVPIEGLEDATGHFQKIEVEEVYNEHDYEELAQYRNAD
jgi:hypothetical protein